MNYLFRKILPFIDVMLSIYFYIFIYYIVKNPVLCNIVMWLFVTLVLYLVDRAFLNCVQKKLQEEEYEAISQIQIADLNYIGTYISYFIIGVSVPSLEKNDNVFYVILCMLFIFLLRTKTVGFNIFHLLNGWHYYNVTNQDNYTMTVLLNRNNLRMVSALKVKLIHNNIYIGTA